jgi:uncharacterized protein
MGGATAQARPWWSPHLRGHVLRFDRPRAPSYPVSAGVRLLLVAVLLELFRLAVFRWLDVGVPLLFFLPALPALALVAIPGVANVRPSQLGLRPWREWTPTEKSYFVQVSLLACVVFPIVLAAPLRSRVGQLGMMRGFWSVFVPYLFFGFYQEVVYRGIVQSELVRRWGPLTGVLAANLLYTFGPLHSYYFGSPASFAVPMFASIFAIGLFFGVVYHRSGNLWMAGVFHAIGNAFILLSGAGSGPSGT